MTRLAPELRLLLAPSATYAALAQAPEVSREGWRHVLARVALASILVGCATAAAATGRLTWSLALSGTLCWSLLIVLQLLTAAVVLLPLTRAPLHPSTSHPGTSHLGTVHLGTSAPRHSGTLFALFFASHAAWSLWLLASAAFVLVAPARARQTVILWTALLPWGWTALMVFAFFREVLRLDSRRASAAMLVHQSLTAVVMFAYIAWAVQLWPRFLALGFR